MRPPSFLAFALLLTLSACAYPRAENDANFTTAINAYLDVPERAPCIAISVPASSWSSYIYADTSGGAYGLIPPDMQRRINALAAARLLTDTKTLQPSFLYKAPKIHVHQITLSKLGTDAMPPDTTGMQNLTATRFCSGRYVVEKITGKTDGAQTSDAKNVAVRFSTKISDAQPWFSNPAITKAFKDSLTTPNGTPVPDQLNLRQTANGWEIQS